MLPILIFLLGSVSLSHGQQQGYCGVGMIQLFNGVNCQTDQTCQRMSTGFFCYRGYCCSNAVSLASGYGSSCTNNNQCAFPNSQCVGNICYCQNGYNFDGQACLPQRSIFRDNSINGVCDPTEVNVNGACYPLRSYYGSCEFTDQCNYFGGICQGGQCMCQYGQIFNGQQCVQDQALPGNICGINQVQVNGVCYSYAGPGESCVIDQQCRGQFVDSGYTCLNGICTRSAGATPRPIGQPLSCRNPLAEVELVNGLPKNCISQTCAGGYHCEYNTNILQYVCCGPPTGGDGQFGRVKMYPGYSNLPLQCFGVNSCTFVDYPYCVYSQSYRHNVCCSRQECI